MVLGIHLLVTLTRLLRPGGVRAVVAESLILKHQLVIVGRSRRRAPNLTSFDRVILGIAALFISARRIPQLAVILKPSTLFRLHRLLVDHKYRRLFSSSRPRRKPGPKGPAAELIAAIVEMKSRNPNFGHLRIAQQISHAFGVELDKDVVRRVLSKHCKPRTSGTDGPSWLTFLAQAKDSLWSVDLFRCESILLRSHWVIVRHGLDQSEEALAPWRNVRAMLDVIGRPEALRSLVVALVEQCVERLQNERLVSYFF